MTRSQFSVYGTAQLCLAMGADIIVVAVIAIHALSLGIIVFGA